MTHADQEPHYVTIGGNLIPVQPLNTLSFDSLQAQSHSSNFIKLFCLVPYRPDLFLNCTHIIIDIHVVVNQSFHPYSADIQEASVAGFGRGAGGQPHCE